MSDSPPQTMTDDESTDEASSDDHLEDVEDGCGCAEVWEHLSAEREEE